MTELAIPKNKKTQLDSLVLLRGIAVMMVVFCHCGVASKGNHVFSDLFEEFHQYGYFGIHIFFVISGFIIPYSLYSGKYGISDYPRFLYKRLLRLHPPYLVALFITLVLMYFSYRQRHLPFPENTTTILKSLAYFHFPADNPVFWTLAVEAQYYLFIGLFYPILVKNTKLFYLLTIPIILYLGQTAIVNYLSLFQYFSFFLIGNVGFMIYTREKDRFLGYATLASIIIFTFFFYQTAAFVSALLTIAFILLYRKPVSKTLKFIGTISYSVYLIHFPFGVKIINLFKPRIDPSYSWLMFIFSLALILLSSWVFYKIFEEFSERLSKKIKYKANTGKKIVDPVNEPSMVAS